jgi:hypothetical protein
VVEGNEFVDKDVPVNELAPVLATTPLIAAASDDEFDCFTLFR